ncbi:MAG: helix-turn-helix transcriptional regulator [Solirubrobacterales bacterium]
MAEQFGRNLKRARGRAGISQEELAAITDLHRTAIGLLERGSRLPRLDTIIKLSGGIDVPNVVLISGMRWHPGAHRRGGFYVEGEPARTMRQP